MQNCVKYNSHNINKSYEYRTIYFLSLKIQAIFNKYTNNVYICIFNLKKGIIPIKLFLLHISICYKNIYLKLSKSIEKNESLFALVFSEILFIPLMHNFDNVYGQLKRKIDLVLFGNSEYISSMMIDLNTNKIINDIGNLFQKNYKSSFLQYTNRNIILEEIIFHGLNLKQNYSKSYDKNLDKIENSLKLELRSTFPKLLFIIKFFPIFKGIVLVHYFNQYKLSKTLIKNPNNPNVFIYDNYKEVDIAFFNLLGQLDENNLEYIKKIEKFFFEYFFILGNNSKENISTDLMTYKGKDYNLLYINKEILQLLKQIIMEYFKDEKDLIFKIKKKLLEEYQNQVNNNNIQSDLIQENSVTKSDKINSKNNINNEEKNLLEFSYQDFLKEFRENLLVKNKNTNNNNESVGLNDINVLLPDDFSNINEYSELNLTKNNLNILKRNIVTTTLESQNKEFSIYNNNGIMTTKNLKTEVDNKVAPIFINEPFNKDAINISNNNEPFKIDVTYISNNIEPSKDEWGFKSILAEKHLKK